MNTVDYIKHSGTGFSARINPIRPSEPRGRQAGWLTPSPRAARSVAAPVFLFVRPALALSQSRSHGGHEGGTTLTGVVVHRVEGADVAKAGHDLEVKLTRACERL